ncbi:MAG TPA: maleylpyruvate isomerase family mycothiol-dependent enzyme [Actinomycetota bacterium]|nr:maleylpyruvate isomerase family mycothiol-dependent enzyme [Actinomycetota bacterium]
MAEPVVALLDQVWSSIEEMCASFTPADWSKQTDLPGWSVQDQLAHLCGIESLLLGRPQPAALAQPWPPHVRNELGAMNEAQIEERRAWAPEDVLTEFLELTAERLKVLAELSPAEMDAEVTGPLGKGKLRDFLQIRVMDSFLHEQDMRRATGNPGSMDGEAASFAVGRMNAALPYVVAKKAGVAEGASVAFEITGPAGFTGAVVVEGGRGRFEEGNASGATATLTMDAETFLMLTSGRIAPDRATVTVTGDDALAGRVLDSINVLF